MCLDSHAHGMRIEHDIFNKPHQVELTIEQRATPKAYARFDLGSTMPMWRVQTEGYTDGTDQLVGVVSRDAGFLDSPDTEWISGGVNTKTPQAVALGRHGNFFHWGFAVSPTYMTDEAKLVFINSVHYIAGFAGQIPIARKRPGTAVRRYVTDTLAGITDEGYARMVARYEGIRESDEKRKADIRARIAAGEEVSKMERQRAADTRPLKTPGRFDRIRRYIADEDWPKVEGDVAAITVYLEERLPYMRSEGWYELVIDEELQRFGIASNDIALLDSAVEALGSADQEKLARTLLERYTTQSFATAAEWSDWLKANRERLFFTEAGGFVWLVDSRKVSQADIELLPTADNPVASQIEIEPLGDGRYALTVHVAILDGWHAYKLVPNGLPYVPMTLELTLPDGLKRAGEWELPSGGHYPADPTVTVYEGDLMFRCELAGKPTANSSDVACVLSYQVCDERMCLPPDSETLTATIDP